MQNITLGKELAASLINLVLTFVLQSGADVNKMVITSHLPVSI